MTMFDGRLDDFANFPLLALVSTVLSFLLMPALVVGLTPLAGRMRQMRGNLLDVLRLDYVTTPRAKGLTENVVVFKHALRNAINPLITLFGYTLGSLVSATALNAGHLREGLVDGSDGTKGSQGLVRCGRNGNGRGDRSAGGRRLDPGHGRRRSGGQRHDRSGRSARRSS